MSAYARLRTFDRSLMVGWWQPRATLKSAIEHLSGGYSFAPEWLAGQETVEGTVAAFIPGQNETLDALIELFEPLTYQDVTGDILVLKLLYLGAVWSASEVVHVELCDFRPELMPWRDRRQGKWAESHATYKQLPA